MEKLRVLMADNHELSRKAAADYLRRQEGVELVREAANGAEALDMLSREPFDILVTDLVMPQMDGYTLMESIARLRLKESDRVASVVEMIRNLGGTAEAAEDTLRIHGTGLRGGIVDAHSDHRIAMAAAIAATVCREDVTILGAECVKKSYPKFWEEYARSGGNYELNIR